MSKRLSGLQREVLALYRQCLREIRKKPVVSHKLDEGKPQHMAAHRNDPSIVYGFQLCTDCLAQESQPNFKRFARCVRSQDTVE